MKKITALFFTVVMLLSCCVFSANVNAAEFVPVTIADGAETVNVGGVDLTVINNKEEMLAMVAGGNYILNADIDFGYTAATPLSAAYLFPAIKTLDGNGHSITGIHLTHEGADTAIFTRTDLTIKNITIGAPGNPVSIKCETKDKSVGTILGYTNNGSGCVFENVTIYSNVTGSTAGGFTGGFIGAAQQNLTYKNCKFIGTVTGANCGGLNGRYYGAFPLTIEDCKVNAFVSGSLNNGGVVGSLEGNSTLSAKNTIVYGNVGGSYEDGIGNNNAGFFGANKRNVVTLENCINHADIFGNKNATAFIGSTWSSGANSTITLTNCINTGDMAGKQFASGLLGEVANSVKLCTVTNCLTTGTIKADQAAAGFIKNTAAPVLIDNSANIGDITVTADTLETDMMAVISGGIASTEGTGINLTIKNSAMLGTLIFNKTIGLPFGAVLGKEIDRKAGAAVDTNGNSDMSAESTGNIILSTNDLTGAVDTTGYSEESKKTTAEAVAILDGKFEEDAFEVIDGKLIEKSMITKFIGTMNTVAADNKQDIRFLVTVPNKKCEKVGYTIDITYNDGTGEKNAEKTYYCSSAYQTINANGIMDAYNAVDYNGMYFVACTITDVPTNVGTITFKVTPVVVRGGTTITGAEQTVVYTNGVFASNS